MSNNAANSAATPTTARPSGRRFFALLCSALGLAVIGALFAKREPYPAQAPTPAQAADAAVTAALAARARRARHG